MTDCPTHRPRDACLRFARLRTRWMDNDIHGHRDNVVRHSRLFAAGRPRTAGAGHVVHVCVDRDTGRPAPPGRALEAML